MKPNPFHFRGFIKHLYQLDRRILVILLVALIFLIVGTAAANSHLPHKQAVTSTSAAESLTPSLKPTPSPFPPELLENGNQTIGLTLAGSILVLIVVVAVVNAMLRGGPGDR